MSVIVAILLQGMTVRLGIIGQKSITQVIKEDIESTWLRRILLGLILTAIMIGNTAYEAGNISGAILGLETLFGKQHFLVCEISINLSHLSSGIYHLVLRNENLVLNQKIIIE